MWHSPEPWLLEYKSYSALVSRQRVDSGIIYDDIAGIRGVQTCDHSQNGGFSTAAGTQQGGRQRVAFARALAPNPLLLLLDEPFAAIDAKVRRELRTWLKDMIGKVGITSIFVTHDQEEAMEVADTIIVTNQGRVEQIGTPEEICLHPQTDFVADFIDAKRYKAITLQ
mgnify:CR=1 FL=1